MNSIASHVSPPHLRVDVPVVSSRAGHFWIAGDRRAVDGATVQSAPMFVQWEAPEKITQPYPVIFIHGGGSQGTDWLGTVDERPGWASIFVTAGFAVYVVDRPGHGRSAFHPDVVGPMGGQLPYEAAEGLFLASGTGLPHTAWPWSTQIGGDEFDQLMAAVGPLPADLGLSQRMDADRLGRLLDRTGPAVLVTHSAGGPVGWLVADARPGLVRAIAAIEPMGPAFADFPGLGALSWGLTSTAIGYAAGYGSADEVAAAVPEERVIPALEGLPIAIFTGGASAFSTFAAPTVDFLTAAGASASWVHLPDVGVEGNGHGLMFELNSDDTAAPVVEWISALPTTLTEEI